MLSIHPFSPAVRSWRVALVLLLAGPAFAAPSAFERAHASFTQAANGDEAAIDTAANAFGALRKAEPANPVLLAYEGASVTLKATTTMLPWKKMSYAEDGLTLLDKSLTMLTPAHDVAVPNSIAGALEVRFVAANTFLAVPGFMNRNARGAKLLGEVLASPLFGSAPLAFRGTVWLRAAKLAATEKRLDDARRYLNEVVSANAPQAQAARDQLKALAS